MLEGYGHKNTHMSLRYTTNQNVFLFERRQTRLSTTQQVDVYLQSGMTYMRTYHTTQGCTSASTTPTEAIVRKQQPVYDSSVKTVSSMELLVLHENENLRELICYRSF